MFRLLRRDLLVRRPLLLQIAQDQLPFLSHNLISTGNPFNRLTNLTPFAAFFFSSSSASKSGLESSSAKELISDFFHSYGFTDTQVKRCIHKCPLVRSTEMIKPKLEHLLTFGFSPSEIIKIVCHNPNVLVTSLKKRLQPNLNLLEARFGSKDHIRKAIVNGPWLLRLNLDKVLIPNLNLLIENKSVPADKITRLFSRYPLVLVKDPNLITEAISKLKGLGMNPSTVAFIHGITCMTTMRKETWERKMKLYGSFGWSETDTLSAFSRQPMCMHLSEEKIKKQMEFFNEKLQWDSAMVLRWPNVLFYSLDGRIIPRCSVLSVLGKNGLWNGKPNLYCLLTMAEKNFKERFVEKHEKEVPQVIDAYQGKIDFLGLKANIKRDNQQGKVEFVGF